MTQQNDTELKWWHKVFGVLALIVMFNQVKSCLGIGPRSATENTQESNGLVILSSKRDACAFIHGRQYPYDWEGSDSGACVQQLPPQTITTMEPDQIGGLFEVPRTIYKDNLVRISSPVGQGVGEWNGDYINGTIATSQGEVEFVCAGAEVTGSNRGLCGLR